MTSSRRRWLNVAGAAGIVAVIIVSVVLVTTSPPALPSDLPPEIPALQEGTVPAAVGTSGTEVIRAPKDFRNVATFCHQGNRVYLTAYDSDYSRTAGSTIAVVPGDPSCVIHQ
jgi:hypothetical protein